MIAPSYSTRSGLAIGIDYKTTAWPSTQKCKIDNLRADPNVPITITRGQIIMRAGGVWHCVVRLGGPQCETLNPKLEILNKFKTRISNASPAGRSANAQRPWRDAQPRTKPHAPRAPGGGISGRTCRSWPVAFFVLNIEDLSFDIVSDFGFRV